MLCEEGPELQPLPYRFTERSNSLDKQISGVVWFPCAQSWYTVQHLQGQLDQYAKEKLWPFRREIKSWIFDRMKGMRSTHSTESCQSSLSETKHPISTRTVSCIVMPKHNINAIKAVFIADSRVVKRIFNRSNVSRLPTMEPWPKKERRSQFKIQGAEHLVLQQPPLFAFLQQHSLLPLFKMLSRSSARSVSVCLAPPKPSMATFSC